MIQLFLIKKKLILTIHQKSKIIKWKLNKKYKKSKFLNKFKNNKMLEMIKIWENLLKFYMIK